MASKVSEWQFNWDAELWYPGVISCMTVTCRYRDDQLGGTHLAIAAQDGSHLNKVLERVAALKSNDIASVYLVGNFDAWGEDAQHPDFRDRARLETYFGGTLLNFNGRLRSFNTAELPGAGAAGFDLRATPGRDDNVDIEFKVAPAWGAYVPDDERYAGGTRLVELLYKITRLG